MKIRLFARVALALSAASFLPHAAAQDVTTLIVPFPAGGGLDAVTRVVGQKMQVQGGGTYVVDNKAGANGLIGAKAAAGAKADGRTWIFVDGATFAVNPFLYPEDASFNAMRDLKVVRGVGVQPSVLVVNPGTGFKGLNDLVTAAKARSLDYASGGVGSAGHLTMESLSSVAGMKMTHIAYRGGAPAMNDLVGGQVAAAFVALPVALPHVKTGKLVALAVSGSQRAAQLPDVPTVAESGYPGFEVMTGYLVAVPAKTPAAEVQSIAKRVENALMDEDTQHRMRNIGIEPALKMDQATTEKWIANERATWSRVIREKNIKLN
jgi:tripartite-type tricarboxylate transporter receptor subunit TctC